MLDNCKMCVCCGCVWRSHVLYIDVFHKTKSHELQCHEYASKPVNLCFFLSLIKCINTCRLFECNFVSPQRRCAFLCVSVTPRLKVMWHPDGAHKWSSPKPLFWQIPPSVGSLPASFCARCFFNYIHTLFLNPHPPSPTPSMHCSSHLSTCRLVGFNPRH